ncbi:MAG: NF038143 family protein [Deltaproteobacteria bacterium]|nr:NF038143 family protein [Deltaproteobacteria bacterium]
MPSELKKKFKTILFHEQTQANFVALKVNPPRPLSVWEVLIPIVFILAYMKSKERRQLFAQNLMFTKKMALEAAYDMMAKNQTRGAALMRIELQTKQLLTSVPGGMYSDAIRQEQLREIEFLIDHYFKLFRADGQDYARLVRSVYPQREAFFNFQQALSALEKRVLRAASQTLGAQTDAAMLSRIESAIGESRSAEIRRIFDSN